MLGRKGLGDPQSWQEEDSGVRRLWAEEEVVTRPGEWSVLGASRKQGGRCAGGRGATGRHVREAGMARNMRGRRDHRKDFDLDFDHHLEQYGKLWLVWILGGDLA